MLAIMDRYAGVPDLHAIDFIPYTVPADRLDGQPEPVDSVETSNPKRPIFGDRRRTSWSDR